MTRRMGDDVEVDVDSEEPEPWPPRPRLTQDGPAPPRRPPSRRVRDRRRNLAALAIVAVLLVPLIVGAAILVSKVQTSDTAPVVGPAEVGPDVKLLIPPGLTLQSIAVRVGQLHGKSANAFLTAAASGQVRSKYEPAEVNSLEGLLWPDTYFVGAKETELSILRRLMTEFDSRMDRLDLAAASPTGLTPYQTLTVASLIEKESGSVDDDPLIAAVIVNRLRQQMPLQIDATLCFAKGGCPPLPMDADKKIDSPYNTYKVTGLPPTPIAGITEASVRAALAPADVGYLYYVAGKDGKSLFATTLAEHERNVAKVRAGG